MVFLIVAGFGGIANGGYWFCSRERERRSIAPRRSFDFAQDDGGENKSIASRRSFDFAQDDTKKGT